MPERFCHLHLHSEYSLLDGVIRIPQLARYIRDSGMDSVALTDHGVMYGTVEFIEACKKEEINPIIGCEVYVTSGSRHNHVFEGRENLSHLVLLVIDNTGYRNLSLLVSKAYKEGFHGKPRIDHELLFQHSEGLIALSACLRGEINQCLMSTEPRKAQEIAGLYKDAFGKDRFYLELQDHGIPEQKLTNKGLIQISKNLGIPLVATNDCHFLTPEDLFLQDVMICIQTGKKLSDTNRLHAYTPNHFVKSPEEMWKTFSSIPEAITNTAVIADMVTYTPSFGSFHFPEFVPPDNSSPKEYLINKAREGLRKRTNGNPGEEYVSRLEYELGVICDMGFASYFLIVADFVEWAKTRGIPVGPGRGSAAGCLVSYSLGITDLDPFQYGLQFERFLNPARKSMPDIDIDFEPTRRAEVIDYVVKTYGEEHVCQIITFNRLKARAAIRDVGRVMDIPLGDVNKLAKMVPWGGDLDDALKNPEFKSSYESSETVRKWIDTARKVEGLTRNASIHAAGVVICGDPIWFHAPVQVMENESMSVCMYSMNDAEKVGLVKMDFLGLRTLTYLTNACQNIKTIRGIDIDLLKIPLDDEATFRMLASGDVLGVFQMESGGMRELLMSISPDRIEDLIATIALFRPGPMENDLHHAYARRKNKKEPVTFRHPELEPILGPTYGILTYQEQISLILQALGGIDLATATLMIKLISKKKERTVISKYKEDFIKGASKKGISRKAANDIWNEMEAFAGYGFNKAHSAAYGLIAYQTAYLKANYPLEFYTAYLTSEMHNQDKIAAIIDEIKRKKISVFPPDINKSRAEFIVEGNGIRYGLGAIKGVGIQAVQSIVSSREKSGAYTNLHDLASRIDLRLVNKSVLESLIAAGACDSLTGTRKSMLQSIPDVLEYGKNRQEDINKGQTVLFTAQNTTNRSSAAKTEEEYPIKDLLRMEKEALGFYLSHHPLEDIWDKVKNHIRENVVDLPEMKDGRTVKVGGIISSVNRRLSKKLQNFATFILEDLTGKIEVIAFPQAYDRFGQVIQNDNIAVIKGRLKVEENEGTEDDEQEIKRDLRIIAEEIFRFNPDFQDGFLEIPETIHQQKAPVIQPDLEDQLIEIDDSNYLIPDQAVEIVISLQEADKQSIRMIKTHLLNSNGTFPVRFRFPISEREVIINPDFTRKISYTPELRERLLEIDGVQEVQLSPG